MSNWDRVNLIAGADEFDPVRADRDHVPIHIPVEWSRRAACERIELRFAVGRWWRSDRSVERQPLAAAHGSRTAWL